VLPSGNSHHMARFGEGPGAVGAWCARSRLFDCFVVCFAGHRAGALAIPP